MLFRSLLQPLGTLDESVQWGTSSTEYGDNLGDFFDFDLLAMPENEPRHPSPPGVDQSIDGGFGGKTPTQRSDNYSFGTQIRNSSRPTNQGLTPSSSSASPSATAWSLRLTSPSSNGRSSEDAVDKPTIGIKVEISPVAKAHVCSKCNEGFA